MNAPDPVNGPDPSPSKDAFFVGFFKAPAALKPYLSIVALCLVAAGLGAGAAFSLSTDAPGQGVTMGKQSITGVLSVDPFPVLYLPPSDDHPAGQAILLNGPGKRPVKPNPKALDGEVVTAEGIVLVYEDILKMLKILRTEIVPAEDEDARALAGFTVPAPVDLGRKTLKGEIVDSQCFAGIMRPGTGKAHMACAILCLSGQTPTVFWVRQSDGTERAILLLDHNGDMVFDAIRKHISLPVEITGNLERRGSLLVLRMDENGIRQIGAERSLL